MLLGQVALQGVPGIKKVSIRETKIMLPDADSGEGFRNENTWVLDTEGTNLLDVSSCPTSSAARPHLLICIGGLADVDGLKDGNGEGANVACR